MIKILKEDQPKALAALYNHAHTQGMAVIHWRPTHRMSEQEAIRLLTAEHMRYFDYHEGRVMKVGFGKVRGDYCFLETALYDRDNGPGAAVRALTVEGVPHE